MNLMGNPLLRILFDEFVYIAMEITCWFPIRSEKEKTRKKEKKKKNKEGRERERKKEVDTIDLS